MTQSELLRNAAFRSTSRSERFNNYLQSDVVPIISDGEFIVRFYIGTPPIETWAILDTGSDVVWIQCLPCVKCYPQKYPPFDPKESTTYETASCDSESCAFLPKGQYGCGVSRQCEYFYFYQDHVSYTWGELARDLINLGGQFGNLARHSVVFGCGHNNSGRFSENEAGIVGLGNGPLSLVSQLGPQIGYKFSYCLVPYFSNSSSKLKLGEEATIVGEGSVSTPLINTQASSPFYILNLEGISVGSKTAKIIESGENGNIVIDSGTTFTFLPSKFYYNVEALVKEVIKVEASLNPPKPFKLCYSKESNAPKIIKNDDFQEFVVHFKDGASLSLNAEDNVFVSEDDVICFAMAPTRGIPFYGNVAQVNFQVGYDLNAAQVSFAPADCTTH
ncbi:aspartic proteinase CDR1-like [Senna tora]|uniref:Aspartic proteinase CDR1-like n=1 Tax=Senna tora TaxID=362788 RepID=A0A835C8I8_9FABA|nr:aspartic proteinase CDR1-like [Senna tora]